jgi:ribonuclease-3
MAAKRKAVTQLPAKDAAKLKELEQAIGYAYKDLSLLRDALVHSSYVNESGIDNLQDNERLEFVGDAVLQFVVSEHLYQKYPGESEGSLTVMRSSIVGRKHCAAMAKLVNLGEHVLVGKGERNAAGGVKNSILANTFEALIAGLYFDGGIKAARGFILKVLEMYRPNGESNDENFKAQLQSVCQKANGVLPVYKLLSSQGPDHKKTFEVEVFVGDVPYGKGTGSTKKAAQQQAARQALGKMEQGSPK